ncbi:hypothetical protein [Sporomusa sp.]|uniref:hypothetical protein n=1 Tax=Sporomusa sp. TaxID=2078658 RepID=UPI002D7F2EB0|nr:hypothetical protein [Sporomusa sp.]
MFDVFHTDGLMMATQALQQSLIGLSGWQTGSQHAPALFVVTAGPATDGTDILEQTGQSNDSCRFSHLNPLSSKLAARLSLTGAEPCWLCTKLP